MCDEKKGGEYMSRLSVVLPAYNEELMVGKACRVLREVLTDAGISYELVVVNDGSRDNTWEEIRKAAQGDENILGVHFPGILARRLQYLPGLPRLRAMWLP